jgi:hypothetical protein
MKYSQKFCCLNYLRQWFSDERDLYLSLNSSSEDIILTGITDAVSFFQVARNLPRRFDVDYGLRRYEPLLSAFLQFNQMDVSNSNFIQIMEHFVDALADAYGGDRLISLSSKLLWLRYREPFIIYDSRARNSLDTPYGDYPRFVSSWKNAFQLQRDDIANACEDILDNLEFVFFSPGIDYVEEANEVVSESWFHERVFDHYLWHLADVGA